MAGQSLLLVSRANLLESCKGETGELLVRKLAKLTREGFQLLAVASQPDEWSKNRAITRRSQPAPRNLRQRIAESGGHLDGVYYIPRSVLTQKKKHEEALQDMMTRFGSEARQCFLVSGDRKLLASAEDLGINTFKISRSKSLIQRLDQLLQTL